MKSGTFILDFPYLSRMSLNDSNNDKYYNLYPSIIILRLNLGFKTFQGTFIFVKCASGIGISGASNLIQSAIN